MNCFEYDHMLLMTVIGCAVGFTTIGLIFGYAAQRDKRMMLVNALKAVMGDEAFDGLSWGERCRLVRRAIEANE